MATRPYRDPKTTKIEDWKWRPFEQVQEQLGGLREIPDYIQKGFGGFMAEQAGRSKRGEMTPRDLIKAYTIAQSSIGRGGLSRDTATKTGMRLPRTSGEVRPEGAFAEWLGSKAGQKYLDMAERGTADMASIGDLQGKFAPFGKQNDQAEKMVLAAKMAQTMGPGLNRALTGDTEDFRDYAEKMKGIAGAKSGFIGSLLGRGDLPTLDARQLNLHTEGAPVGVGSIMNRGKGKGAREAVDRLAGRQHAMNLLLDPELLDYYQHLAHHAVWDKTADAKTTHSDLVRAMRGYAKGGQPSTEEMQQALMQKGYLTHTPKNRNPVVGQRFGVGEATGLADKTPVDLEQYKGASVMLMPWDSTSRNVPIRSLSGQDLPEEVLTHGGHDFARDLEHILRGYAGASNLNIAKRIAKRESKARVENLRKKGTGQILHLPTTMGNFAEGFALTPAEIAYQLHQRADLTPAQTQELVDLIRNTGPSKFFRGFVGFKDPKAYAEQIRTGEGLDKPSKVGELRKVLNMKLIHGKRAQELMDFNGEDVQNAMLDAALRGVPKGRVGNTVISSGAGDMQLTPSDSDRDPYDTRFSGKYLGTLGQNIPAEVFFKNQMDKLGKQFTSQGKTGSIRNMVLGALEKRNNNVSQILDNETLDRYGKYMLDMQKKARTGSYADGGAVEPDKDTMLASLMLRKTPDSVNIKDVGVNEAPDLPIKAFVSPNGGSGEGLPIGGVDFQPLTPGNQMMPMPQPQGGLFGQPPAPPQGGMPPPGAPGAPPPRPNQPQSNILALTPQGQAMQAMRPNPQAMPQRPGPTMPKMAKGGTVEEMRKAIAGAAKSSGMKAPVVANRDLTTMQDSYESLNDRVRKGAMDMQDMIESMPFKYEPGQHVFTAHSASKNLPPFQIVRKALHGNDPVREDHPKLGAGMGKPVKDPATGKTKRTPYEPGYHVRREVNGETQEYRIPESAILGHLKAGGSTHDIQLTERKL